MNKNRCCRTFFTAALVVAMTTAVAAAEVNPSEALAKAKASIAAGKHADALASLEAAIGPASTIADPAEQKAALTAIHFYAALADFGLKREDDALSHLREVLRITPTMHVSDPSKFDKGFIALFDRVKQELGGAGRFDELYPGYADAKPKGADSFNLWEDPAVEFLGTRKEKSDWRNTSGPAERTQFLRDFWRLRDRTPGDEANETWDTFSRRVSFADAKFETPGVRGGLSDRGRVFALLGEPALVRRRAITSADRLTPISRGGIGIINGVVEYWVYTKAQLPVPFSAPTVTYRFVTHQGIGDYILQRDGIPMNVLSSAAKSMGPAD